MTQPAASIPSALSFSTGTPSQCYSFHAKRVYTQAPGALRIAYEGVLGHEPYCPSLIHSGAVASLIRHLSISNVEVLFVRFVQV